jgi:UDP-N-acetyl-D-glucosamine/UDP-N-acetyl-D-galactosamine dehydrogenase
VSPLDPKIAVVGLGYVGLPVATAFARRHPGVIGFDIDQARVDALNRGDDWTQEVCANDLKLSGLRATANREDLRGVTTFIVCVPTPVHPNHTPDLRPLAAASEIVGSVMQPGAIVVYESTVYPGVTEDICAPILAKASGLTPGTDFRVAYSPERINPGDKEHSFSKIKKVVAANDPVTAHTIADLYSSVVEAGVHVAPSIKVAEAAKVLENTQRDLNIALMNELAIICDHLGVRTKDVLDAAATKWNFLNFRPGLVGGHCIGVDPYYLTTKAEELGYHPQVILAGRRINDSMGAVVARRVIRFLSEGDRPLKDARVGILGVTFKENIRDTRNSRVPDIVRELAAYGVRPMVTDPLADPRVVSGEDGVELMSREAVTDCDALILAVPHRVYLEGAPTVWAALRKGGVLVDVTSSIAPSSAPRGLRYWSL